MIVQNIQTKSPYQQEPLATYPIHSIATITQKIRLAEEQFASWKTVEIKERAICFERLATLLEEQKEALAVLMTKEMGKPISQSRAEIEKCVWLCHYYAQSSEAFLEDTYIQTNAAQSWVTYEPLGLILQIMPWNFPFWQSFRCAVPALMAGNVTMLKHAPNVLGCAFEIERLFTEAGFPKGVFQTINVDVDKVDWLMSLPALKGVALTGSVRAGSAVGEIAGRHIKPYVLELGGSDAFIVLEDADLEEAAKVGVASRLNNSGQTCIAAKRFIVQESVADEFLALLKQEIAQYKLGNPMEDGTKLGPMAREDLAVELQKQVDKSVKMGAKVLLDGGHQEGTSFFEPMILGNITTGMPAYSEELFGAVFSFFVVKNADEAIQLANDTAFGLGGAIWSKDRKKATVLAKKMEVGAVAINNLVRSDPRMPFGGVKKSGVGRELGQQGLYAFVNVKTISVY